MLTHFSLCSGIGGLDLAAEWAGFETVGQCEIEPYASKVLAKNFPGVHNFGDIRTITAAAVRAKGITDITVLSAGIPCQPYSLAGKGLGDGDERDLEQELIRVVGEFNPKWVIVENTPGLFARKNQRYFDRIIKDLSALGRTVAWGMWGACDVGAWHKRDRVFIVGHSNSFNEKAKSEVQKRQSPEPCRNSGNDDSHSISKRLERGHGQPIPTFGLCETVSDANSKSNARLSGGEAQKISELRGDGENVSNARCGRHGAQTQEIRTGRNGTFDSNWWTSEPCVGRLVAGCANRVDRLRCLGNMVVPQQAYPIFKAIADYERTPSGEEKC